MNATKIPWADVTINPVIGCTKVSPACDHCYAERMANRLAFNPKAPEEYQQVVALGAPRWNGRVVWVESAFEKLLALRTVKKPCRVFLGSMTDLFQRDVPDEWIDRIIVAVALMPRHTFMVLTKRAAGMREYFWRLQEGRNLSDACRGLMGVSVGGLLDVARSLQGGLPSLWLGVTAENRQQVAHRVPHLLETPAAVRFVSVEPMLEPVDLQHVATRDCMATVYPLEGTIFIDGDNDGPRAHPGLDWVICGCESGPKARPTDIAWVRCLRDQCAVAGVPFFLKQVREGKKVVEVPELDGVRHVAFPKEDV